jgi:hypothetical protein
MRGPDEGINSGAVDVRYLQFLQELCVEVCEQFKVCKHVYGGGKLAHTYTRTTRTVDLGASHEGHTLC